MINNKHFKTYTIDEKEFIAIIEKLATSNLTEDQIYLSKLCTTGWHSSNKKLNNFTSH